MDKEQIEKSRMTRAITILEPLSLLCLLGCGVWIFFATPIESGMGFVQKIMYLHVPSVIVTYTAFFIVFVCSIAYLWKRDGILCFCHWFIVVCKSLCENICQYVSS